MAAPETRSEILFLLDAAECNPNGDPKAGNRPRVDPHTGQAIITDVRLKRYLRDQLQADGHEILVKRTGDDTPLTRTEVALEQFAEITSSTESDEINAIREQFLAALVDIRYFGAVLSFQKTDHDDVYNEIIDRFPRSLTGPVQFSPARSLNEVELNEGYDTLSSIMATQQGNKAGAFGLGDYRIAYGLFPFTGVIDPQRAETTQLTPTDVQRLDTLCWRAIKNQTVSRSKFGQEPQLYLRLEYTHPEFHIGRLDELLDIAATTTPIASPRDYTLDIAPLLGALSNHREMIKQVYCIGSHRLQLTREGTSLGSAAGIAETLETICGVETSTVDVYDEYPETLPAEQ
ncbi:type I-B CRISPR-associated protein Cas7/Csh2 [Haloferax sp. Atlit-6N]|uniref:type I-B CRISPR-associated protein Cas7/Csh2 n=1 Tax=Haloferax sp. Atlit-6N TaxID=2077205 RepID=UPI000E2588B3|nr:type I-B CRISPR-associated protein Cas7/Csh2 [Haloferax sp. Atlit-6N]REA02047.1 type I-B CRISPR-associated protein Cas7/Csh2 [Haloferax sp. Atlit-6N]